MLACLGPKSFAKVTASMSPPQSARQGLAGLENGPDNLHSGGPSVLASRKPGVRLSAV